MEERKYWGPGKKCEETEKSRVTVFTDSSEESKDRTAYILNV